MNSPESWWGALLALNAPASKTVPATIFLNGGLMLLKKYTLEHLKK